MAQRIDRLPDVVAVPITLASLAAFVALLAVQEVMTASQRSVVTFVLLCLQIATAQATSRTQRRR